MRRLRRRLRPKRRRWSLHCRKRPRCTHRGPGFRTGPHRGWPDWKGKAPTWAATAVSLDCRPNCHSDPAASSAVKLDDRSTRAPVTPYDASVGPSLGSADSSAIRRRRPPRQPQDRQSGDSGAGDGTPDREIHDMTQGGRCRDPDHGGRARRNGCAAGWNDAV